MTISAADAHPFPIYNARFRFQFPILDADGDLVSGAAALDSEVSQNSGTFADAVNEATEIATASGMYFLDLVATEMDTKSSTVIVKTSTAGAKTTPITLHPVRLPVIRTGTAQAGAATTITLDAGASAVDDFYNGCWVNITNDSPANVLGQARQITDYVGSTKVATVSDAWGTNPSVASTFEILLAPGTSDLKMWAGTQVDDPATVGLPDVRIQSIAAAAIGAAAFAAGAIDAAAIGTGAIDADSIAADAITAAKIANAAIDAATFAAGAIDAASIATAAITAAKFGAGAIDAAAIGTGAIDADAIADNAIDRATFAVDTGLQTIRSNTAAAGAAGSITLDAAANATDDFFNDCWVFLTGGTGAGQARLISDYVGATKVASVIPNWVTNPDATTTFAILPQGRVDVGQWVDGTPNALIAGRMDSNVQAMAAAIIAATTFAAGAIDAAAIANGAIDALTFAAGAIDAAAIATGAIDADAIAAGAITAAKFASGAVDANALNADAVDEIWDELMVEQAQGIPGAAPAFRTILAYIYMALRNRILITNTNKSFTNDALTVIWRKALSDDGTSYQEEEGVSGP